MSALAENASIAVVIPALNEVLAIRDVVSATLAVCPHVYVVDDGSTDGTSAALEGLPVHLIRHPERQGKGAALASGFRAALAAGHAAVVSTDGDGQHAAVDIRRLEAAFRRDPSALILCSRSIGRENQPLLRRGANHFADFWVSWACGQRVLDSQCGQRLYPRSVLEGTPWPASGGFAFESEFLIEAARAGFRIAALPIIARYHAGRRASHFRPLLDIWRITRMVSVKIIGSGMYPQGLIRSLTRPALRLDG